MGIHDRRFVVEVASDVYNAREAVKLPMMSSGCFGVIFAHQGGWDEALWVMIPAVGVAYLLRIARLRAEHSSAEREPSVDGAAPSDKAETTESSRAAGSDDIDPDR